MPNSSSIGEFLLLALADTRQLQLLHFWLFLGISLSALLGNGLISSPSSTWAPSPPLLKAVSNAVWDTRAISYSGCAAQVFFFLFLISAEYYLLTVMSYDHYVAAAAWGTGVLYALLYTANTFSIPLCHGNTVDQFFCETAHILKLSCSQSDYLRETWSIAFSFALVLGCCVFIVLPYVQIFRAVPRMPSEQGRHKASTCLPRLAVVSLFVSTVMFAYLKPSTDLEH